jgi:chorismate dehydratase
MEAKNIDLRGFKFIETADGSLTLYNPIFDETYHSKTAGAVRESLEKFVYPSLILEKAKSQKSIVILEVGFGLGYNAAVAITELLKVNPNLKITYWGLDLIVNPLIEKLSLPQPYGEIYQLLKHRLLKEKKLQFSEGNLEFNLILGDATKTIKGLNIKADAIFHDAFSPQKNPQLWSLEFFKEEKRNIKPEGFWVSFSVAKKVRQNLLKLGFKLFNVKPVGRRAPSTAASLNPPERLNEYLTPLEEKELKKLLKG